MRLWPSIIIVTLIVITGFLALYLETANAPEPEGVIPEPRIVAVSYDSTYEDDGYTISGYASVPNQCLGIDASGSYEPESNTITIALTNESVEGICLLIGADLPFEVFVRAPEDAAVRFTANGEPIEAQQQV